MSQVNPAPRGTSGAVGVMPSNENNPALRGTSRAAGLVGFVSERILHSVGRAVIGNRFEVGRSCLCLRAMTPL